MTQERIDRDVFAAAVALMTFEAIAEQVAEAIWDAAPTTDADDGRWGLSVQLREVATRLRDAATEREPIRSLHVGHAVGLAEATAWAMGHDPVDLEVVLEACHFVRSCWSVTPTVPDPAPDRWTWAPYGRRFRDPAVALDRYERALGRTDAHRIAEGGDG